MKSKSMQPQQAQAEEEVEAGGAPAIIPYSSMVSGLSMMKSAPETTTTTTTVVIVLFIVVIVDTIINPVNEYEDWWIQQQQLR